MWLVGIIVCFGWIFSLCLHEFGHAIVAYWGGDTSVKSKGYLTFNPLKYTDPGYSLVLPVLFLLMGGIGLPGGAVYINQHKLRNRWWQSAVSAAGPSANILIALLLAIPLGIFSGDNLLNVDRLNWELFWASSLAFLVYLQIFAAIFNLLPMPGLDGYGIIEPWLPEHLQAKFNGYRKYSTLIIIGLFWFVPAFNYFIFNFVSLVTSILNVPESLVSNGAAVFREPINKAIALAILVGLGLGLNTPENKAIQTGKKAIEQQQYQAAIQSFDRAIQIRPDGSEAWLQKGYCLWQLELFDRAIGCYQKVITIDENNEYAYLGLGLNLFNIAKYSEAIFYLEKLIKLDSKHSDAYYYLGLAHQRSQNLVLADEALNKALSLAPKRLDILQSKAALMHELRNYQVAINTYQKIVEIEPSNATGHYDLACCYALQGQSDLAISHLKCALKLEPEQFKERARKDSDLDLLRKNLIFKNLIA
ncbi:site-2 protease family protein [Chamaesiphon minutus]|uniref:Zn-dependent protease n=1 Tax=Chamaesiphon minutus (strain ATCC 27169 / PCC 6605) TaxID=1173020 RepID=K9UJ43_CHAP6|nr:site-2 protease family protein [Chamaesiphon minutus]AFY95132.1 Zn-dependent protease [Chamaesiphon minutus PCC 6605]